MRVVKHVDGGIVRRVVLIDDAGAEVVLVTRFLAHLADSGFSPNTLCAYGYDLRRLVEFVDRSGMWWDDFTPARALEFLGYLAGCRVVARRSVWAWPWQRIRGGCCRRRPCSGYWPRRRAFLSGPSRRKPMVALTIRCRSGWMRRWRVSRIVTGLS